MIISNSIPRVAYRGLIWTALILGLCVGRTTQADVATFAGSGCLLNLRVLAITESQLTVEMKRADIEHLRTGVSGGELYGDRFSMRNCADEFKVKLVSISEQTAILRLPRDIVSALEIEPVPGTAEIELTPGTAEIELTPGTAEIEATPETAGDATGSWDVERAELQAEVTRLARDMDVFKARITEEGREFETGVESAIFGSLRGRMLVDGRPYAGAVVKVRRLDTADKLGQLFDAVTDSQGVYRFEQLPEGLYDMYWIPPGKNYWVRQLKQEPAVAIRAGAEIVQPDVNADMKVL